MQTQTAFGMIIIGDEILTGKRTDRHLPHVIEVLNGRGLRVGWCRYVGDDLQQVTDALCQSQIDDLPVLCFGGIGATPDDCTRQAAAAAFGRPLTLNPEAAALIESQFGEGAYPYRMRMAELPEDCLLIPNPSNNIPGFTLYDHHFLPGFPSMAWPMLDWLLDNYYLTQPQMPLYERSCRLSGVVESQLLPLLEQLNAQHRNVKLFCLPRLGEINTIEVGFRGEPAAVDTAFEALLQAVRAADLMVQSAA